MKAFLEESKGVVIFFDEGRFGLQPVVGRQWARRGSKQRVSVLPGYRFFYIYAGVSPLTGETFMLYLPGVDTEIMNVYLRELSKEYKNQKVLIFMDRAGWHTSKKLSIPPNIQIELLPPYSPELNPVEHLWQWLRRHSCRNRMFSNLDEVMNTITTAFKTLSSNERKHLCHCNYLLHYK